MSQSVRFVPIDPKPGEVVRLTPGLNEGTVKGRLAIPTGTTRAVTFEKTRGRVSVSWNPPTPDNWESMSDDEKREWSRNWQTSEDARKWMQQQYRQDVGRGFQVNADGAFEVDGIRPGTYTMEIEVFEPTGSAIYQTGLIATAKKELTVPGEPTKAPVVDIGDLELEIEARVATGDIAPAFEVKTVDGETLRLEDFRGKFVFLDFWAVWCGPCKAELPTVRALFREFGGRNDFAVVSLSLDNDAATPREYAKANDMPWVQGFLGKWSDDTVTKTYGVRGIPATFLIGPDGRMVARDLRGPEMVAEVRKILEKQSSAN
jgi:peroxiredoxin